MAVGSVIGEAFIDVKPRTDNFGQQTEKGVEGGLTSAAKKAALVFGTVLATGAAAHFVGNFVKAANESQKISRVTDAVLKSTGNAAGLTADQIGNLATSLSNLSGVDDELIQSSENVLLTFTNVRDAAGAGNDIFSRTTQAALDMAAVLGGDPQAQILALGKALNDPAEGLTRLTRSGITFTDQQKEMVKQLQASGDLLGAQKIVLDEVNREFGGAAKAAADPFAVLSVVIGNLQEAIGGALIPVLGPAATALAGFITQHTPQIAQTLTDVLNALAGVLAFLKPGVENVAGAFRFLFEKFGELVGAVGDFLDKRAGGISKFLTDNVPLAEGLSTAIVGIGTAFAGLTVAGAVSSQLAGPFQVLGALGSLISGLAASPVLAITAAIVAAAGAGELLFQKVDLVRGAFESLFGKTLAPIAATLTFLNPFVPLAVGAKFLYDNVQPVRAVIDGVAGAVSDLGSTIADVASSTHLGDLFAGITGSIDLSGIADTLGPALAQVAQIAGTVGSTIADGFATASEAIRSSIGPAVEFLTGLWAKYGDEVTGILVGFRDIAVAVFERAAQLVGVFAGQIANVANTILAVAGPAFRFLAATVAIAISPLADIIGGALAFAQNAFETFIGVVGPAWSALWGLVSDVVANVIGPISDILEGFLSIIQGFVDIVAGIFTLDWSRIWDGVSEIVGGAIEIVTGVLEEMLGFLSAVWSNAGTLITLPFTTAATIIGGVVNGISIIITTALQAALDFLGSVWSNIGTLLTAPVSAAQAIISGLIAGVVTLFSALPGQITDALSSFPTLLADLGTKLIEGLSSAVSSAWETGKKFFTDLGQTIVTAVGDLSGKLVEAGSSLITGFFGAVGAAFGAVVHFAIGLGDQIKTAVGDLGRVLFDAGRALIQGFIDGIGSIGADVVSQAITSAISPGAGLAHALGIDLGIDIGPLHFASGGIIPGQPGAAIPIVAHGQEVVLNGRQQAQLIWQLANLPMRDTAANDSAGTQIVIDARIINEGTIIGLDDFEQRQEDQIERIIEAVGAGRR